MTENVRDELQAALGNAYALERELGGGGMSRVFVAREMALAREVVVKVLTPELAAGVSAERFAREVRLAARLQQANIVPVLNAGDANGLPWYAMPFVRGESLRARLALGAPVDITDAVHILRDVARALAYAHGEGIVHRDIKPENILLSGGAAVVTDFGIAKALTSSRTQGGLTGGTLTQVGTAIGTPAYMSPEQSAGDPGTDHRADIYSWGVVAWELIAGRHPFAGRTSPQALLAAHMGEVPPALATVRGDTPPALASLVAMCMQKDPVRRPGSAGELLATLDQLGMPDGAAATRRSERRSTMRWAAIAAGTVVVAAAGWAAARTRGPSARAASAPVEKSLAVLPFESVGGDTANIYFAEGMADELTTALAKVGGLRVAATSSAFTYRNKTADVREVGKALNVAAVLQGRVRRAGTRLRVSAQLTNTTDGLVLWGNSYEREVRDVFAVQDELTRDIVGALRVTLAGGRAPPATAAKGTSDLDAYDLYLRGNFFLQQRGAGVARSIGYFRKALARDSMFARAWAQMATAYDVLPLYSVVRVDTAIRESRAAVERALTLDSSSAEAYAALAVSHVLAAAWAPARSAFERAIALDPAYPITYRSYMVERYCAGRFDDAIAQGRIGGRLDPLAPTMHALFSIFLLASDRRVEALGAARRASELDSLSPLARPVLAVAEFFSGHAQVARGLAQRTLRVTQTMLPVGFVLAATGDHAGAAAIIRESERLRGHSAFAESAIALTYLGAGDTTRALAALTRAAAAREPIMFAAPFGHPYFDAIRRSPRFAAVIRAYGLDPAHFGAGPAGQAR